MSVFRRFTLFCSGNQTFYMKGPLCQSSCFVACFRCLSTNSACSKWNVYNLKSKHISGSCLMRSRLQISCYQRVERSTSTSCAKQSCDNTYPIIHEDAPLDKSTKEYNRNVAIFKKYVEKFMQAKDVALAGGGEKSIERHVKRHGKMLIHDRVKALVDNIDDFLELSLIGGIGMEYGHIPRANVLAGIGKIKGRYCLIISNDGAFKGGAIYPVTLKKNLRAQEIAALNRLPCVYLVDSAGAFLPLQSEIFNPGGQTFYNQAVMSSRNVPQIAIVCGSCTAGGAYIPTMADEAVIVHKTGTVFLGGPPLVQAALGEVVSAEELGGATVHCGTSGCTDYFAINEAEAYEMGRNIIDSLNVEINPESASQVYEEPLYDVNDIPGLIPPPEHYDEINMYKIIARIVDGSRFHEFKIMYGKTLLAGFARIEGHLVGILASHGEIDEPAAAKGAHFVQLCTERDIPLVFLQNTTEDLQTVATSKEEAISLSTSLKSRARMMSAVSCTSVPKLTVIIGNGFGPQHYLMGGPAVEPHFLFAWPNARVAIAEPNSLAQSILAEESESESDENMEEKTQKLLQKLQMQSSSIYGATRILNDGIILPSETRKVLSQCLSICKAYRKPAEPLYPVLRM